jgi:uncharacterized protein YecA (UPF0149 family)
MRNLNALTLTDALDPADREIYGELTAELEAELCPVGPMEIRYAAEILRAMWRLESYAKVENTLDVDKPRVRAMNTLRHATAELRRLQTERQIRADLSSGLTGLASTKELVQVARAVSRSKSRTERSNEPSETEIREMEALIEKQLKDEEGSQCVEHPEKTSDLSPQKFSNVPRNWPCPCKSGQKYKRCCGREASAQRNLSPQQ